MPPGGEALSFLLVPSFDLLPDALGYPFQIFRANFNTGIEP
jgi:hypothetical protein